MLIDEWNFRASLSLKYWKLLGNDVEPITTGQTRWTLIGLISFLLSLALIDLWLPAEKKREKERRKERERQRERERREDDKDEGGEPRLLLLFETFANELSLGWDSLFDFFFFFFFFFFFCFSLFSNKFRILTCPCINIFFFLYLWCLVRFWNRQVSPPKNWKLKLKLNNLKQKKNF